MSYREGWDSLNGERIGNGKSDTLSRGGHGHGSKLSTKLASGENLKGWWLVKERCFSQLRTDVVTSSNHWAFIDLGSYICLHFYILYFSVTSKQCQVFKGGLRFNMGVVLVFASTVI